MHFIKSGVDLKRWLSDTLTLSLVCLLRKMCLAVDTWW